MPSNSSKSAIGDFIERLHKFAEKTSKIESAQIIVGWEDGSKEQERTISKKKALAINERRKAKGLKGRGELVSNFDADFIGPGIKAASLATIAKVMRFGRAGGINAKTGKPYGEIPARDFVSVLRSKYMKPIVRVMKEETDASFAKNGSIRTSEQTLNEIANVCKGQLLKAMKDSNEYKANAPITVNGGWMANPKNGKPFHVEGKKSSRPLWNTGKLMQSITYEIKR